ncbi:MAG: hypothetical protein ACXABY_24280 [Candidatus Thorarchaeota archaeon]|jgi:hypothetical protein
MRRRKLMLIGMAVIVSILLMPKPVSAVPHDPDGEQANSGTWEDGDFIAFVLDGYDDDIWTYVNAYDYYGDFYVKGESDYWGGPYIVDYYCLIKIRPADSSHKYLQLATDAWFHYGLSTIFAGSIAKWSLQYVVLDMGQNPPIRRGWSSYNPYDWTWGMMAKYNKHFHTSASYMYIYDTLFYGNYYEFTTSQWYYVGIWIRCELWNFAEFFRYSQGQGNAKFNPAEISWSFFT